MLIDPKSIAHIVQTYFHILKTFQINFEIFLAKKKEIGLKITLSE